MIPIFQVPLLVWKIFVTFHHPHHTIATSLFCHIPIPSIIHWPPWSACTYMLQFPLYLFKDHITTAIFLKDPMIAATALRLSFHDCVGGCDGCVNMGIGANVGLGRIFHMLTKDWEEQRDTIGKNLWQLSKNYLLGAHWLVEWLGRELVFFWNIQMQILNLQIPHQGLSHNIQGRWISRADWIALAGIAAVDFTRDLYQPNRRVCKPGSIVEVSYTQFLTT